MKALRLVFRMVLSMLVIFLLVAISLQIPDVQTKISKTLTEYLSKNTGFDVSISKVKIRWWDAVSLQDVLIYDHHDSLMVDLKDAYIDFSLGGLLSGENPSLDQIKLENGNVRLLFHPQENFINIAEFIYQLNLLFPAGPRDPNKKSTRFDINNISLKETSLDIINYGAIPIESGFDFNTLRFRDLIADADEFYSEGSIIGLKLNYMRGTEATSGLVFQQLKTNFTYSPTYMEFDDLYLRSNDTEIKDYLKFSYASTAELSDFNRKVIILARFDEAALDIQDLKFFTTSLTKIEDRIFISGEVNGTIDDLSSEELLVRFGEKSALFGKFQIDGLPEIDSTFFEMSLINSTLNSRDLSPYIGAEARKEINKFRDIRFDTDFSGYLNYFTANGNFRTGIGDIIGRLNYREEDGLSSYNGRLQLKDLDVGILVEDRERFQKVSMIGSVQGTGLTLETALLKVDAEINHAGFNGYEYVNIVTDATYGKDLFSGNLKVNDPNLKGEISGILDLRDGRDSIRMTAKVDTAYLKELKFLEKDTFISGKVVLDTKGVTLDDVEGIARFSDIYLSYEGRNLYVDNFYFQSLFSNESRLISLNSDLLVAGISGNFKVQQLLTDVQKLSQEYLSILSNSEDRMTTYTEPQKEPYSIDLNLKFIDINPIINLIDPRISISKNTVMEGAFYQTSDNTIFNFFSGIDTIFYDGNFLYDTNLDFNTSKLVNSADVLASFYILSKKQQLSTGLEFDNLAIEAIWNESKIDFTYDQDQLETGSYVRIKNQITIYPDHTVVEFAPSELKILDKIWNFDPDNNIFIAQKSFLFDNVKLYNENQFIALNGTISPDPDIMLGLEIHQVNVDFFNTLSTKKFEGLSNGNFGFTNFFGEIGINGQLNVENLHINNFLIGNIEAATFLEDKVVNVEISNVRNGKKVIGVEGFLGGEDKLLNLNASLKEADLSVLEPFLSDYLTEMGGLVSGDFDISGSINYPVVQGNGLLTGGTLLINYLKTKYTVDGNLIFNNNEISFRELTVKDIYGNQARMRGGISHDYFSSFVLDVSSTLENFQVLNTGSKDNDQFYGAAYVSGTLSIFGAANNLDITARATSQKNTRIFIPLGSDSYEAQGDFITIINVLDTTQVKNLEESVDKLAINTVRMNFTFDVTPDAYLEIQIDPRTGETIQGRGKGVLTMNIDTQGNFSMAGNYEITEAKYNFSLYNVLRKEFIVEPGGRISWFGDPYEGTMDVNAYYLESVSLQSLQTNQNTDLEDPMMRRRFPLKVLMNLKGQLLSPEITFGFDFAQFPTEGNTQNYISAFKNRIANDEQEKNRQVFSVIMMRSLSPEGQFSGVSNIATSNLSQLLSSQLNSFIAQVDQNLEVDIDLANLDQTALETFQLRVAYTFLDGRLRVSRDGGFTDLQGNANFNSIAGDWQAEYLVTQDGRYRVRVYNRNNFDTFTSLSLARNVATYGVSVSQNLAFNTFGELWDKIRNKEKQRLRINDQDDFLRYRDEEDWQSIPLDSLTRKVNPLDYQMDDPIKKVSKGNK